MLLVVLYNVSKYSMIFHHCPHKILDASPSSPCCTSGAKISELGPESEPGGTIAIFIQTGSVDLQVAKATDIAGDKERHQRKVATCGNHHFSFWVSPRSKWWNSNQINQKKVSHVNQEVAIHQRLRAVPTPVLICVFCPQGRHRSTLELAHVIAFSRPLPGWNESMKWSNDYQYEKWIEHKLMIDNILW